MTLEGSCSYDFHEFLSLLGLGFVGLHVTVLVLDRYVRFSRWQVLHANTFLVVAFPTLYWLVMENLNSRAGKRPAPLV